MVPRVGRGTSRVVGLGVIAGMAGWLLAAVPTSAASPGPTVTVTPAAASVGSTVVVQGQDFPPQMYNLQVAVCGNLGLNGTGDCDAAAARTTFTAATGTFAVDLVVAVPPKPCPCAIVASAPALSDLVKAPFTVMGAPVATPAAPPPAFEQNALTVENAKLEGSGDWQSWFGAATTRDLVFTIHNTGTTPVDDPLLVLTAGKGNNPEGVVTPPRIGRIEAGARRTVRATVPIETLSVGSYTVKGRIGNTGAAETFRARTRTYPWGLLALAILMLLVVVLWIGKALRRLAARRARKRAARAAAPADVATASLDATGRGDEQRRDDEWTSDDEWTEDDEWADDEDAAEGNGAVDVESDPAEAPLERAATEVHWHGPITPASARDQESERRSAFGCR